MKRSVYFQCVATERGAVLVLVLIVTAILLMSSFWVVSTYRRGVHSTSQLLDKITARVAGQSTVQLLAYYGSTGRFTSRILQNTVLLEGAIVPGFFDLAATEISLILQGQKVLVSLQDSAGLVNVWYAPAGTLRNLLLLTGASLEEAAIISDSLRDWRDQDDFNHINGAESWYYTNEQGYDYGPRNGRFVQDIEELSLLRGMTAERFDALRPYLAMSPVAEGNFATMSPIVLAATLGLQSGVADDLVRFRHSRDHLTTADIESITQQKYNDFISYSGFPSRTVRARITSQVGEAREQVTIWFHFVPDLMSPYRILSVQAGGWTDDKQRSP